MRATKKAPAKAAEKPKKKESYVAQIGKLIGHKDLILQNLSDNRYRLRNRIGRTPFGDPVIDARFEVHMMHGCCGVGVAHEFDCEDIMDSPEAMVLLVKLIGQCAWQRGFTCAVATDTSDSDMITALTGAGWEVANKFLNRNSSNTVLVLTKTLTKDATPFTIER